MITLKLEPNNSTFQYEGQNIKLTNFNKNIYTGLWTFDIESMDGIVRGVPISTGTNIVKGNGLPFYKLVFIDEISSNGDVTVPNNVLLYILEEGD